MNGVGFVISAKHNLIVPVETVEKWRLRFPAIDLEAKMAGLAAHILKKGPMGCAGWDQPEAWMVSLLADENRKAQSGGKATKEPELEKISRMVDDAFDRMHPHTTPKPMRLTHER